MSCLSRRGYWCFPNALCLLVHDVSFFLGILSGVWLEKYSRPIDASSVLKLMAGRNCALPAFGHFSSGYCCKKYGRNFVNCSGVGLLDSLVPTAPFKQSSQSSLINATRGVKGSMTPSLSDEFQL